MSELPHSNWAHIYDLAYEVRYGAMYRNLTQQTIDVIQQVLGTTGSIIDFGAGTGRTTIPLLERGYQVTAVEPCRPMADELLKKAGSYRVDLHVEKMEDFQPIRTYDMALCIFTVIAYILEPDKLKQSLVTAYESLRSGGVLLLEVPSRCKFISSSYMLGGLSRNVSVQPTIDGKFEYIENISYVNQSGVTESAMDRFTIRCWEPQYVNRILEEVGFVDAGLEVKLCSQVDPDYRLVKKA